MYSQIWYLPSVTESFLLSDTVTTLLHHLHTFDTSVYYGRVLSSVTFYHLLPPHLTRYTCVQRLHSDTLDTFLFTFNTSATLQTACTTAANANSIGNMTELLSTTTRVCCNVYNTWTCSVECDTVTHVTLSLMWHCHSCDTVTHATLSLMQHCHTDLCQCCHHTWRCHSCDMSDSWESELCM